MISSVLALFEKIATNPRYNIVYDDLVKAQSPEVQQAIYQQDGHVLKSLFCNPAELANKTTVFQS